MNSGLPQNPVINALAVSSSLTFAAINSGPNYLYRSTNNGQSWQEADSGLFGTVFTLVVKSNGYIFAATSGSGVFLSTNDGSSWASIIGGLTDFNILSLAVGSNGDVYAGTQNFSNGGSVFRSTDNGNVWAQVGNGLVNAPVHALATNGSNHVFAGTDGFGIYRSTDNGVLWIQVNTGLRSTSPRTLAVSPNGYVHAGTLDGLYRSTNNGDSWALKGLPVSNVSALGINASNHLFAAATQTVFRSTNRGNTWVAIGNGLPSTGIASFAFGTGNLVYAAAASYPEVYIYRSTDNGDNWTQTNFSGPTSPNSLPLAANSNGHVFVGGYGVYRSTDNGTTWTQTGLTYVYVNVLAVNSSDFLFAGTQSGVFRSTDNGSTWTQISTGLIYPSVQALAMGQSGNVFASATSNTTSGLFRSTNNGDVWTPTGLTFITANALAVNANGRVFAGSGMFGSGAYRSTDSGNIWTQINSGLTNPSIGAFAIDSEGFIFAATYGNGVFRSAQSTTLGVGREDGPPLSLSLRQNYPNPFNPRTIIAFHLQEPTHIVLKVFNVLGQEVTTLVNGEVGPGEHQVEFVGNGLAGGCYFYRLDANGKIQTRKMILMD